MSLPVLTTKLFIPPSRYNVVLRQHLIELLNHGLCRNKDQNRKLTLISAPAGFGKTTLVGEWIRQCETPAAWLSLDDGENDLNSFLIYLVAALQTIDKNLGESVLGMLESPQKPSSTLILTALLNEITTHTDDFILVLDDYHVIDSKPVDHAVTFLLDHLPPQMHLVIATREDPHLPLARLRAKGQLTELRSANLRFTPEEADEFLNRILGLDLSEEDIAALEARTEGWIAGLQLAAISMQGHQDTTRFIQSFTGSHHFVMDYLIDEVLGQQPENVQTFLLRTAILDRMCGPLCDAILLDPATSGQEVLEHLERTNMFIVPLDNERLWYRYHHLFRDLLRQRLDQPQELSEYHLRASAWYESNADQAQAFHHAIAAGDFEQAARLAEAAWQAMDLSFNISVWLSWVNKLPNEAVCSRPLLCVQVGSAFTDVGESESSETFLQNAERVLTGMKDQEEFNSIPGTIALIRARNAQLKGNFPDAARYAELSAQLAPENDLLLRSTAANTLGFTNWAIGNVEASLQAIHTWRDDMERVGNEMFVIASAFVVADMQVIMGRLGKANQVLRQSIQQAETFGQEAESVIAYHHLRLAMLAYEQGDGAAFAKSLQTVADLDQRTTLLDWPYRWNLVKAQLEESKGEWDSALDLLDLAGRVYIQGPIPIMQPIAARKARINLKQGRLDKAQAWVRERGISVADEVNYLGEYEFLTLARLRLLEGSFDGINELLDRLLVLAESQKRGGSVIDILLTRALVHQAQGEQPNALAALERALTLAEPEGYQRIFVDEGEVMRSLLLNFRSTTEKQSAHSLSRYVNKTVAAFSQPNNFISESMRSRLSSEIIETLTDREIEVLRLVAKGHSNAEIGQQLYLTLSTVKGHNLRIFSKLQVHNRTEAVARARELGLF
ncbi:MAG TPA: LuxR C-terminal-related transcriptional regulator [Anaerolineaceae bacterium]|nr:LuxR C-terminal-related transcriptional regulator [Anaerolineaceae bacterium]